MARTDDLSPEVEGFGPVKFPVTPARARNLLSLGQPARFGRGEETLADPDVRDTWEIPKHLVRAARNDSMLKVILTTVKEELGLPNAAELTADLHFLLVYEPNQFFLARQDTEKDDSMIGGRPGSRGDARAVLGQRSARTDAGGKDWDLRALRQGAADGERRDGRGNRGDAAAPVLR